MDFVVGCVISLRHYSGINPFKSIILEAENDKILVKLTKDFAAMNFLPGDPVVVGYELDDEIFISGCNILDISPKENIIRLSVDKVDAGANLRQCDRYPVSLYGDIRAIDGRKKHLATIKDVSYYGMLIYSKADVNVGDVLNIDIYMDKNIVFLKTNVIRKLELANYIEYGLGILYEDSNALVFMKDYIKRLRNEQEEAIRKLKTLK